MDVPHLGTDGSRAAAPPGPTRRRWRRRRTQNPGRATRQRTRGTNTPFGQPLPVRVAAWMKKRLKPPEHEHNTGRIPSRKPSQKLSRRSIGSKSSPPNLLRAASERKLATNPGNQRRTISKEQEQHANEPTSQCTDFCPHPWPPLANSLKGTGRA